MWKHQASRLECLRELLILSVHAVATSRQTAGDPRVRVRELGVGSDVPTVLEFADRFPSSRRRYDIFLQHDCADLKSDRQILSIY